MKHIIETPQAPAPIGPYNQAVKSGHMLYTSGQIPLNPETGMLVDGGIREQTIQVFENLKAILEAAGTHLDHAIKMTIFITDMADFPVVNAVCGEYFSETTAPARSTVQVVELPKGAQIEIELMAKI